jgi:outer membrane scaffolding protein for murein synthesis (MipA/OmpV family)
MGEYSFGPIQVSGKLTKGNSDYGTTATVEVGSMFHINNQLTLMTSVGSTWADTDHMKSYFGVSPTQSARSGYGRYDAKSGIKSIGLAVGAFYSVTENWEVKVMVKADKLLGDAADSPIVKDDFNPATFVTMSYKF